MNNKLTKILLLFIVILAFVLRFYKLASYPALNADEAAIGYNVYSLIQTGRDEHGNTWPIHFQSFNDYKPGLFFYLVLPFVKVLGLNEWAVRIPGAILGVLTVLVLYHLVKKLFDSERLALISSFFLAISPWHIHFSRGGWEVNAATFFIILGTLYLIKSRDNPTKKNTIVAAVSLIASMYTYHAARVIVPLLSVGFICFYWKSVKGNLKKYLVAIVLGIILLIPLGKDLTKGSIASRAAGVGLFADAGPINRINEQRGEHADYRSLFPKLLHNKAVNYSLAFLNNWVKHYHGEFLFLSGDVIQRNKVPETGQMYIFDFLLILIGIICIIKKPDNWGFIVYWLLIAPVASALTFQSPHALRAQNMVIPIIIISAYGLNVIIEYIKKSNLNKYKNLFFVLIGLIISWSFGRYLHEYYVHMAKEYSFSSQYGLKELVSYVSENESKYKEVYVTDTYDQPYILFLFYLKYPPQKYQSDHAISPRDQYGFSTVRAFDKYNFESIKFDTLKPESPNSLIIGTDKDIPGEANIVKKIYFPNGDVAFKIVAN
jgi:4-amino-4-deoxy-L-arabinose transferase-like glycosyltransferase